ncbi:ral GTPase-activating protein subunit beta isoform X1 [Folsomia candida]|uniref:ral GTPase-activating protein subunit beta isoform X1 n=1 Tax=Folsomia candida TaxID=158441 RepID=UPI000B901490|nr:ral GTPase-activating protein subunit beta isoform X1 [Folsomia candida]
MYWEWATLTGSIGNGSDKFERSSVLTSLPPESAKEVVGAVVRHVVSTLGISQPPSPSSFDSDVEVEWCLQVVCYGLSLPLADHEIIKDCVSIYCEWLSCLAPIPKISVPKPVVDRPDFYARKMINQLYHLFLPRKGEVWPFLYRTDLAQDTINRQAILCHRVLRILQNVIKASESLEPATWSTCLLFLIAINDAILSPPSITGDIGDQLCDRVLSVLFEVWLLACAKSFPSPTLWKTLRESCQCFRHRSNLFDQWNRINLLLTGRVLNIMYGPEYVKHLEDDGNLVPANMSDDCVVQTWYRFLHTIGNPVDLTQPTIISQTQNFLQYAISSDAVVDPCQHPCLSVLPSIFHKSMAGIAGMVDAFLGLPPRPMMMEGTIPEHSSPTTTIPSPVAPMRRLAKSFSVATSTSNVSKGNPRTSLLGITTGRSKDTSSIPTLSHSQSNSIQSVQSSGSMGAPSKSFIPSTRMEIGRPKVNSILHLFGPWLFESALTCSEPKHDGEVRRTSRSSSVPAALPESIDIPHAITIDKYYQGRAEALGILCRIFCSKKTGEDILPSYLARFYIAVHKGLKETRSEVLVSILSNSPDLFRVDLEGVTVLMPAIVESLEAVLPTKDALRNDLRQSSIQLLLSMISLPFHFLNVPIKEVLDKNSYSTTFIQLKPRLANLLTNALQVETDSVNIQMLLGGLMMFVSDTAAFEELEKSSVGTGTESPTNLFLSENTSMRSFSDYSNSFDEHALGLPESGESCIDSAHALFIRTTYLVCHRLISTWKTDLPVSIAALELLNGLGRIGIKADPLECRRTVKWVCDFIIHQCSRPPPSHSKDLHSSIVAAFQCQTTWLTHHPYLLDDKETLHTVLEVVEFGISGTKSQSKPGEPVKMKDEKDLKPVSLRVRDAAEALLAVIFEQVGRYAPCSGVKTSPSVDEYTVLSQVHSQETLTKTEIISNYFRYFVIDHSILVSLFEEALGNDQDPQPTVTMVLRVPTGRHAWTLQLRHLPRNKGKLSGNNPTGRPLPMTVVGTRYDDIQHRYFPESADRIVFCKADKAIPPLDFFNSESGDQDALEQSRLSMILENQIRLEKSVENMIREETDESYPNLRTEAQAPPVSQEFQTARLLLSNLGFITVQDGSDFSSLPKLVAIDSRLPDFMEYLETLDSTSCRTCDTVHVFYVRNGQKCPQEILSNVQSRANVHPHFVEFLLSLGWPVNVSEHEGWTGNINTSWKRLSHRSSTLRGHTEQKCNATLQDDGAQSGLTQKETDFHGGSLYNGDSFLYWSDVASEIAFIVPTTAGQQCGDAAVWDVGDASPDSPEGLHMTSTNDKNKSKFPKHIVEHGEDRSKLKKALNGKLIDTKIFVVWLESFEDSFHFPSSALMSSAVTGLENELVKDPSLIIFIHALKNGLFRIRLAGESLRMGLPTPLVDGMVVSRRTLGNLVRQTALNMARRKRLENDSFQPPHVRRKFKIQEMATKFATSLSCPEFYTQFFQSPHGSSHEHYDGLSSTTTVHHV